MASKVDIPRMIDIRKELMGREVELPPSGSEQEQLPEQKTERAADFGKISVRPYISDKLDKDSISSKPVATTVLRDIPEIQQQIENILEEDLAEVYSELSPLQQIQFKIKGEQTAKKINILLQAVKIKIQEIVRLILDWLGLLPNVSRYFIQQEAKIKAEKILKLRKT